MTDLISLIVWSSLLWSSLKEETFVVVDDGRADNDGDVYEEEEEG